MRHEGCIARKVLLDICLVRNSSMALHTRSAIWYQLEVLLTTFPRRLVDSAFQSATNHHRRS